MSEQSEGCSGIPKELNGQAYLHLETEASVAVLHKLPHGRLLGIGVLPELARHRFQIHFAE